MSVDLDLSILKTLITNKKYAIDFSVECDAKLFSNEYWNFANLAINYIKTYKELPTQRVLLEKNGKNEKLAEMISRVWKLLDNVNYNSSEYKHDLERIKTRYAEKQIALAKDNLSKFDVGSTDSIKKAIGEMQKTVQTIRSLDDVKAYESFNIKEYLPAFVEKFNAKKKDPGFDSGIKTKYSFFDYATNGVKPADFILIAGESGFGKSLFLNNIAIQTWMQDNTINQTDNFTPGKNVIYFSLEMPYEDCFNRLLSRLSGVESRKIETANLSKEEFVKLKKALDFINKYPNKFQIVDIADACANDLDNIYTEFQERGEHFDLIFIDYLGIMNSNQKNDDADWLNQGVISYEIRAIARKHKLPIFSAVQLNRKPQGKSKEPEDNIGLARLARSATIATHATHVIQIESRSEEEKKSDFIYHFIKNRKGPKGKGTLIKNLKCATLIEGQSSESPDDTQFGMYGDIDISDQIDDLEL